MSGLSLAAIVLVFGSLFAKVFYVLLFLRVILSYVVRPGNGLYTWLVSVTEPLLAPLRRFVPQTAGFDLTPFVAFILLQLLEMALASMVVI